MEPEKKQKFQAELLIIGEETKRILLHSFGFVEGELDTLMGAFRSTAEAVASWPEAGDEPKGE